MPGFIQHQHGSYHCRNAGCVRNSLGIHLFKALGVVADVVDVFFEGFPIFSSIEDTAYNSLTGVIHC